ncbi:hypothetical protein PIB30_113227, partial [Stylosanthes scabra]|nr:hypothetical protein [Stylosanthes scabra]
GAPEQLAEWKCARFEDGLREEILNTIGPIEIRSFAELVNKCRLAEQCSRKWANARSTRREHLVTISTRIWHLRDGISRIMGSFSVAFHLQGIIFLKILPIETISIILVKDLSKFRLV